MKLHKQIAADSAAIYTMFQNKKSPFYYYFLNNSMTHRLINLRFDKRHPEERCYKYQFCPPRLKTVTTLPREIRKSYYSS